METPLRLACDFDGVCHDPSNIKPGYKMGVPIDGAFEALWKLKNDGAIIVIHSIWADTQKKREAMSAWLNYFKMPYDFITNIKPDCDFFIDDKSIHHVSWSQTLQEIKERKVS
jgi:hypothetical protein